MCVLQACPHLQPTEKPIASFDIAFEDCAVDSPGYLTAEAEIVKVCSEVVVGTLQNSSEWIFRVGHARLQRSLLGAAGCGGDLDDVLFAIRTTQRIRSRASRWRHTKGVLSKRGVHPAPAVLKAVEFLLGLRGQLDVIQSALMSFCPNASDKANVDSALRQLESFRRRVELLSIAHDLRFDLGLAPPVDHKGCSAFCGIFFVRCRFTCAC